MSMDFDPSTGGGSDYLDQVGTPARLDVDTANGAISLCAWINPDVNSVDLTVINRYNGIGPLLRVVPGGGGGGVGYFCIDGGNVGQEAPFGSAIPQNTWTHVGGSWNGSSTIRCVRNGVQDGTDSMADQNPDGTTKWHVGIRGSNTNQFDGRIAEIGLWSAYLSDAEWAALGKGCSPLLIRYASLVGYWPLWNGTSPVIELTSGDPNCALQKFNNVNGANHAPVGPPIPQAVAG